MKNIIVAIDFSETSFSAYYYAAKLAELLDAELTVLHVISVPMATETGLITPAYSMPYNEADEKLKVFVEKLPEKKGVEFPDITIKSKLLTGSPAFSISEYANDTDAELVVMGTIEKNSIFNRMIGSVTTATIGSLDCPALLVHKNTRFAKPEKIVFAIDHKGDIEDALEAFNGINNKLQSYTEFIHVKGRTERDLKLAETEIVHELIDEEKANYSFEIKEIDGDDTSQDIIDYCIFAKADMLAMVHHDVNFFKRIFTGSVSFQTAENTHLPVLIIPED